MKIQKKEQSDLYESGDKSNQGFSTQSPVMFNCCPMLHSVTHCCPMLPFVAQCCSMLPNVAQCCPMLPNVALCCPMLLSVAQCCPMLPKCCSMLPNVAQMLPNVAQCRSILLAMPYFNYCGAVWGNIKSCRIGLLEFSPFLTMMFAQVFC